VLNREGLRKRPTERANEYLSDYYVIRQKRERKRGREREWVLLVMPLICSLWTSWQIFGGHKREIHRVVSTYKTTVKPATRRESERQCTNNNSSYRDSSAQGKQLAEQLTHSRRPEKVSPALQLLVMYSYRHHGRDQSCL